MGNSQLTRSVLARAMESGVDDAGVVAVADLPEHGEQIQGILPGARSLVVVLAAHNTAALASTNNQVAQFDTMYTYDEIARSAHGVARFLSASGHGSVAVPAFIPLDMSAPAKGMQGEICWRRAGVRAGLGSRGENGLLVTREFGSAVRISGILTRAELAPTPPLTQDLCSHCMACVKACPARALSGAGKVNKKQCGDRIFKYGFRYFREFAHTLALGETEDREALLADTGLLELWQTFMTGNYYYCFACQVQCPSR
ncbi:MAG: 4Fe-4S binding protein [Desulfobacterales bacterium]|nr:4Fe-4S binding protein [Desulfobacterales bacterium]